jgi:serine/threonine protein kinase
MANEEGDAVSLLQGAPLDVAQLLTGEGAQDALFVNFITQLLQVDPKKRPTAAEALQHPWLATDLEMEEYNMELL